MDREAVIRMAREAGFQVYETDVWITDGWWLEELERFAGLVAAAERTRLHDKFMEIHKSQQHSNNYWHFAARKIKEEA